MDGHANFQITQTYLSGFQREYLASNADTVRAAISQHITTKIPDNKADENSILGDTVELKESDKALTITEFLTLHSKNKKGRSPTELVVKILMETSCQDGVK